MNKFKRLIIFVLDRLNYNYDMFLDKKIDYVYKLNGDKELRKIYLVNFLSKVLMHIMCLLFILIVIVIMPTENEDIKIVDNTIKLNEYGKNEKINVKVSYDFEKYKDEKVYEIFIPEKELTDEEKVNITLNNINDNAIKGNNKNLNEIKEKLNLITTDEFNSKIHWESNLELIDTSSGEIIRPYKGEGNKKVKLKLYVQNGSIKKVKEFNVTICEKELSKEEVENEALKDKIEKLIESKEFYDVEENQAKLVTEAGKVHIKWQVVKNDKENYKKKIMLVLIMICILFIYNEYRKILDKEKELRNTYELYFPNFIEQFIILLSVGFTIYSAIDYIAKINKNKSNNNDFMYGIIKINNEVLLGLSFKRALEHFGKTSGSQIIKRFVNNLIYNMERGDKELVNFLQQELKEAMNHKYTLYIIKAKKDNIKMILPLMINFISVIVIVLYPAMSNLKF